jgi:hypothetical protein
MLVNRWTLAWTGRAATGGVLVSEQNSENMLEKVWFAAFLCQWTLSAYITVCTQGLLSCTMGTVATICTMVGV